MKTIIIFFVFFSLINAQSIKPLDHFKTTEKDGTITYHFDKFLRQFNKVDTLKLSSKLDSLAEEVYNHYADDPLQLITSELKGKGFIINGKPKSIRVEIITYKERKIPSVIDYKVIGNTLLIHWVYDVNNDYKPDAQAFFRVKQESVAGFKLYSKKFSLFLNEINNPADKKYFDEYIINLK